MQDVFLSLLVPDLHYCVYFLSASSVKPKVALFFLPVRIHFQDVLKIHSQGLSKLVSVRSAFTQFISVDVTLLKAPFEVPHKLPEDASECKSVLPGFFIVNLLAVMQQKI